jgi:probable phosphoglycerate mutase
MTTFLLVRHAQTELTGISLSGRAPGISLSTEGRREARELSKWLSGIELGAVFTSPLQRTRETAEMIAGRHGLEVQCRPAFIEVEYGDWTGRSIAELRDDSTFQQFNSSRSSVSPPNGEAAVQVQIRAVRELTRLTTEYENQTIVVVTHAEVIRLAIAHYAAIPLDFCLRLKVDPASISTISLGPESVRIHGINQRPVFR